MLPDLAAAARSDMDRGAGTTRFGNDAFKEGVDAVVTERT